MKKKRMEYCEVISRTLPSTWGNSSWDILYDATGDLQRERGGYPGYDKTAIQPLMEKVYDKIREQGYIPVQEQALRDNEKIYPKESPFFSIFFENQLCDYKFRGAWERVGAQLYWIRPQKRACIYYRNDGYRKIFELDSDGNTLFFPSALDAVNYLADRGWSLDKTFTSAVTTSHSEMIEHWVMSREVEVDE